MIEVLMEETQMGMSSGLAMTGKTVITFYAWDFLISATNQLVNHVDKYTLMTDKKVNIIIRLGKGSDTHLIGFQHKGNYLSEFKSLCPNIKFYDLTSYHLILDSYVNAYEQGGVHVLVEYPELYFM
jgi:pyruvate/2-oxoglutarate/acetoin dehydrogenase E1 component